MANSKRLYKDNSGRIFIPMNVEGGSWNENFMTTPKLIAMAVSLFTAIFIVLWLKSRVAGFGAYVIFLGLWFIGFQYVLRYIIFEEKFYYRMYKIMQENEITTPAIFWNIASIKDTDDGALLTYADGKIGIIVKLERDTITGKSPDFKETHYDALSDFYKEIVARKYSFVQMNIMEHAGKDPRLNELDKLTYKNPNPNIRKLMEKQIGYIKTITHSTLYESDYILIYTNDLTRMDYIVNDVIECIYKVLDGGFIGYRILRTRDIVEFIKEEYGVKYFNTTEATLTIFKKNVGVTTKPFTLSGILYTDGEVQELGSRELNIINTITSGIINGTVDINKVSIKDALKVNKKKEEFKGVDFRTLSEIEVVNNVNDRGNGGEIGLDGGKVEGSKIGGSLKDGEIGVHSGGAGKENEVVIDNFNQQKQRKNEFIYDDFSNDDETIDF